MLDKVWKDEYYLRSYQLARSGMSDIKVAKALGVTYKTFKRWKVKKRALRNALQDARTVDKGFTQFRDYVYDRLPENLQQLWDELMMTDRMNTYEKVEQLLSNQGKKGRQHLFLYAMVNSNFDPTAACRAVNITRKTLMHWCETEPEFAELMEELEVAKKDFFEAALVQGVKEGDPNLIKFANMTKNVDRGYNPKTVIAHEGSIEHNHNVMKVDELDLPIEDRRKLLEALRNRREALSPTLAIRDKEEEPEEGDDVIEADFQVTNRRKK